MIVNPPARPIALLQRYKRLWRSLCWLINLLKASRKANLMPHSLKTEQFMQKASRDLLNILNVRVELHGKIPEDLNGLLIVANHVSWLDILAMVSVQPMQFIAKQEIQSWPLLGKVVAGVGTVFINRSQRKDTAKINSVVSEQLKQGQTVAFFENHAPPMVKVCAHSKVHCFRPLSIATAPCYPLPCVISMPMANAPATPLL